MSDLSSLSVGPIRFAGGRSEPILRSGTAVSELVTEVVMEGVIRVRLRARAHTDLQLLGFRVSEGNRVESLEQPVVVLSHPNLDQESRGVPTHRLRRGDTIVRGFDQALNTPVGTLVISCERPDRWVTIITTSLSRKGAVIGITQEESPTRSGAVPVFVASGSEIVSDSILIGWWADPFEGLEAHAELMGKACHALKPPVVPAPRGWNSWDHYGWMINEKIVRAEAAALPTEADYRWVGISGPWFDNFGDWQPHLERFPRGIRELADELHADGLSINLWVAPFLVEDDSHLFHREPDWLLKDGDGRPVFSAMASPSAGIAQYSQRRCAILDGTHPQVQEHLAALASRLTIDYGADYLFVDFLRAAETGGHRWDTGATGVEALRRGLTSMRRGLRDNAMLMGASGTVGLYPGLVHAGRVGPDITIPPLGHPVFTRWTPPGTDPETGFLAAKFPPAAGRVVATWRGAGGIENEAAALASRWYLHGRALQSNPDALLVSLSWAESRTVAAVWAMTGGILLAGDSLVSLPPDRRALLTHPALLRIHDEHRSARPTDLFARPGMLPNVWRLEHTSLGDILALTCWDDFPMRRVVTTERSRAEDLWTGQPLRLRNGRLSVTVPAHDTALLRFY